MIHFFRVSSCRLGATALLLTLCACGALGPTPSAPPTVYSLDGAADTAPRTTRQAAPTLIVSPPHAAAGYASQRIAYVRAAHQLEYYAHSEWIAPPAQMIAPLIVAALEAGGNFRAVVLAPSAAAGDLRLDTELVRLQHDLLSQPGRVRLTLRAYLLDNTTRTVIAWREFDERVAVTSEGPYGAVIAANRAVQATLQELAAFAAEAAEQRPPPAR